MYPSVKMGNSRFCLHSLTSLLLTFLLSRLTRTSNDQQKQVYLGMNNSMNQKVLGNDCLESSFTERGPEDPGGQKAGWKLAMCPCCQEVKCYAGLNIAKNCIRSRQLVLQVIQQW